MSSKNQVPTSLIEAVVYFSDERAAWKTVVNQRWPEQVFCPRGGSDKVHLIESRKIWRCNGCTRQFSVKTGTIFEESPISFSKWLPAMWLIVNAKNGISSCELARSLKVTQKTAWFMLHRIREAMDAGTFEKLEGLVEADETFIGGKAKNMHKWQREGMGRGSQGKAAVHGMIERNGKVIAVTVPNLEGPTLRGNIHKHVSPDAIMFTDEFKAYDLLNKKYRHHVIDHSQGYVAPGGIHTNTIENFWSLLKRGLHGTYISVEPFHLFRYVNEQVFRFNERKENDQHRFLLALRQIVGKRLTYNQLTGKELAAEI